MQRLVLVLFMLVTTLAATAPRGAGAELQPFFSRNLQPILHVYGLPPAEGGFLTPAGAIDAHLAVDLANNFVREAEGLERVVFDGESYRFTLALRHGFGPRWEGGVDLPLVGHGGGFLDGFIDGWHELLGIGGTGREESAHGRLDYRYEQGGQPELAMSESGFGLGDISLHAAFALLPGSPASPRALSLRGGVKLPTGDPDQLRGSGSTDLHLRLAASDGVTFGRWDITLFGSAGILWLGDGEVLEDRRRHWAGFGNLGLGWQPLSWLALKTQVDGNTSLFRNSHLEEVDGMSAQLVMGGTLFLPRSWNLDLAVAEDVIVNTAPDVVFHLALHKRFR